MPCSGALTDVATDVLSVSINAIRSNASDDSLETIGQWSTADSTFPYLVPPLHRSTDYLRGRLILKVYDTNPLQAERAPRPVLGSRCRKNALLLRSWATILKPVFATRGNCCCSSLKLFLTSE